MTGLPKRVVLFATDDSAAECLTPLAAAGCQVLGITCGQDSSSCLVRSPGDAGSAHSCAIFARRCVDLGFSFSTLSEENLAKILIESFKPDFMVCSTLGQACSDSPPKAFMDANASRKYLLQAGQPMPDAPWPEFAPIWLGQKSSVVKLVQVAPEDARGVEAAVAVPLAPDDTALSLRQKHAETGASLVTRTLHGDATFSEATQAADAANEAEGKAPCTICIDWCDEKVERYVRARNLPPHDAATVSDPSNEEETYFIETMEQYREFQRRVLRANAGVHEDREGTKKTYAADTHWYSNVGGSIVKMGDSDVHKPLKTSEKKKRSVIPGAALGSRKKLRMNEPLIGPNAERYCSGALASGWIGVEGPYVKQFEKQLARICGCAAACAVQSGTAALYGAMKALGVSDPSHHVLVPSFTCAAAADAVVHAGGHPVAVDCELRSYGLCAEAVRATLESDDRVVGVVLAPCYGVPAWDMHKISALCKDRGIWLCEDACETYGALKAMPSDDDGAFGPATTKVPVGSLATLCVVSTRSEKMIGVGEGGAILGNDQTLVARAKWWCSRAPTCGAGLWRVYEHDAVGQNFRMPELLAAVGCAASEMLPVMIERKRRIHDWYSAKFAAHPDLQGVKLQECATDDEPVWWINAAFLPEGLSGEDVGMRLMKDYPDIEIRPGFYPLNLMQIFQSKFGKPCPNSEMLYKRLVCLPSSNQLQEEDIDRITSALAESLKSQLRDQTNDDKSASGRSATSSTSAC